MKMIKLVAAASAAFFIAGSAFAQNAGSVTNHAFVIGKGPGQTGYTSLLCGSAQLAVGQSAADPICKTITGDVTISAAGATTIGATKVTSAMLNADVFSTAHSWSGQQTFVAPVLGTPASGTLTNATGLPVSTGISGLGTGVATALAVNVGSAGAPVVNGGALGTPSSGTLTNATGLPVSSGISGLGTGVATFLATPSSANLRAAVTGETGTGALVFGTSPNITTPTGIVKSDVGLGNVANVDQTNASNITSGTLNTARLPSPFTSGTASGNTSKFATTTGTLTNGNCVKLDANGNFVDAGAACGTGGGGGTATVNSITANYTVATSDCENVIQAGTGSTGFFTVTLPAVTGFPTTCLITVKNDDTGRGKLLAGFPSSGMASNILWPKQQIQVRIVGGAWTVASNPGRWQPVAGSPAVLQVNHASGSDTNNDCLGTGSGACATIQNAIKLIQQNIDSRASGNPTVQNADETFTESVVMLGQGSISTPCINVQGNSTTPANVVWQSAATAMHARDGGCAIVSGFTFKGTTSSSIGIEAAQFGIIDFGNVVFDAFTGASNVSCSNMGSIGVNAPYTVRLNMSFHVRAATGCSYSCFGQSISLPNALAFTNWFIASQGANISNSCTFSGPGATGGTGSKFNVNTNAILSQNGVTLPGPTAGTTATGGQAF